ncbi:MAG: DJ-1/PfpI family protein [Alphaproteobacteria bacterium]
MINNVIVGKKAAILIETGFCERELLQAQKSLSDIGVDCRLVSTEEYLVKGWNEVKGSSSSSSSTSSWGGDYAPDATLDKYVASEYDILVIPGGLRSIAKLKLQDGVKPFVSGFIQSEKPVIAYNQAVELLSFLGMIDGYSIAANSAVCDSVKVNGGRCTSSDFIVSKNLITLSRFSDADVKLKRAVLSVLNGERYIEKEVSSDNMPYASKVA